MDEEKQRDVLAAENAADFEDKAVLERFMRPREDF